MKVFISHSSKDHDFVLLLAERLGKDLIDIWIDDWELKAGDSIIQKINEGLEKSSFLIIVFSEYSIKSDWVLRELNSTLMRQITKKDVKILPILLEVESEELPPLLSDIYAVKFSRNFINETQYKKLIEPIREIVKSVELIKYQDIYFENIPHIDMILGKKQPTRHEVEFILKLIQDGHYRNYFFKKVTVLHWFNTFKNYDYFKPSEETKPQEAEEKGLFSIPQWNVLPYLEKVSQQVNVPGNEKYIDELLGIIQEVTDYHIKHEKILDNYRTWYYFVKILCNIPNDKIPIDIINLIPIWLDSKFSTSLPGAKIAERLLPKFLTDNPEDIKKAEKIIESITAIKTFSLSEDRAKALGKKEETRFLIDPHWLKKAFDKYSEIIGEKCSKKVIEDLSNKIRRLLEREEDGTYMSFYDEPKYSLTDPLDILTFIFKKILLAKARNYIKETEVMLRDFIGDKYLYFPKMALYVIGQNTDIYNEIFWQIIGTETGDSILANTLYFGDELKHLLKNLKNLTDEQRKTLNEKIENAVKRHDFKEDRERYIALSKQEIYEALSHDQYFKNLYDEMKKITNVDVSLHPVVGKVETRWGPGTSPFTKEEIMKMPNDKLAEFLATFKTKDSWRGPTVGGLAELLAEVAKENPEKFIEELNPLKDTGFIYVYEILKGVKDAWNGKKIINWNKVFEFIELYIDRKEFWEDKFIVEKSEWLGGADHQWITGMVAELIQDGIRDDSWAFPEQYFEKAEKIIFLILDNLKIEEDKEITDYVTYTLNTPFGKALTALILLALRIARVNDKKGIVSDIKWKPEFKERYEEILNSKIIEGFTCLGRYLPNFYYLDKGWTKEKIKSLDNEKGNKYWEAFMDGYLSIGMVYEELYDLMRIHYQNGLFYNFKERNREHLIQHICIGYLRDRERLDDPNSLFRKIIDEWKPEPIKEIIGFFWMQRDYLKESSEENEKIRARIIDFWKLLYERYKGKDEDTLSHEDKQILSSASKLAALLPQIDTESYNWLMLSAPYVHEDYNSSFFIEYLNELKDKGDNVKSPRYIGEIFLKMLEKFTPDFDEKHIRSIVEFLCTSNNTRNARKICDIYGQRGYEFLRKIYENCPDT
ncbi:MAG: toll/interleukin-1 receptor domain-containing protein [Nitrospirota bacterium]